MLGLYEFKHIVGENEIGYHLSAQKYVYFEYRLFKISYEWDSTSTKV